MNTCLYCQKSFSNPGGLGAHHPFCKANPNRIQRPKSPNAHRKKGTPAWNKGLTKAIDNRIQVAWNKGIPGSTTGKGSTEEKELARIRKITEKAKLSNGGYRQGSGRGKKGWYKGFFCDSSWELAYVIYCLEHNISIKRNVEKREYIWQGIVRYYIPDFLVNNEIIEIKGYKTKQWLAKLESNPDVKVLYETELKPILSYVTEKYGKHFTDLYENIGGANRLATVPVLKTVER